MNQNRRPMSAVLQTVELPPDAIALIREGTPKGGPLVPAPEAANVPQGTGVTGRKDGEAKEKNAAETTETGFSNASFRLPTPLQQALLRISLERKLKRKKPWTQQEIAVEALELWLKKNSSI